MNCSTPPIIHVIGFDTISDQARPLRVNEYTIMCPKPADMSFSCIAVHRVFAQAAWPMGVRL